MALCISGCDAVKESKLSQFNSMSEATQLSTIKQNGTFIKHIETPGGAAQMAAVLENPSAIVYIDHPAQSVQSLAVQKAGYAIKYVKSPSEKTQAMIEPKDDLLTIIAHSGD